MALKEQLSSSAIYNLIKLVSGEPQKYLRSSYDEAADVLYINFKKPAVATDSALTDDDILIGYEGDTNVGLTVFHASKRSDSDCD